MTASKWNYRTAAHLLNRAGFGGSPSEIEKLANLAPEKAVASLLDYEKIPDSWPNPDWAKPDPERMEKFMALRGAGEEERRQMIRQEQQSQRQRMIELRGWWLQRMARGPRPFQEKMVLFWHGHFATSVEKVKDAYLMWRQNELFRRLATGNWTQLLTEAGKDPAMLIWLDQAQSRRQHPNENFARELMELFALGEGNYIEKDVTEAARALTGWSYDRREQQYVYRPFVHDDGVKTVLGRTGNLTGDDVVAQIVAQPQAARFITTKLWKFFAEAEPSSELVKTMAELFRKSGNNFKPFLRAMFLSEEFYDDQVIRNQVKSPVQWLIAGCKTLERDLPPTLISYGMIRNLGQDLFAPPNVKGWDGGLNWISTNSLLARYNQAAVLVQGDTTMIRDLAARIPAANRMVQNRLRNMDLETVDSGKILNEDERKNKKALLAALERRLLQAELKEQQRKTLVEFLDSNGSLDDRVILNAIRLIMSTPEYQLT